MSREEKKRGRESQENNENKEDRGSDGREERNRRERDWGRTKLELISLCNSNRSTGCWNPTAKGL